MPPSQHAPRRRPRYGRTPHGVTVRHAPAILRVSPGAVRTPQWRDRYVPVRAKFLLSCLFASSWMALSIWLSLHWVEDLARVLEPWLAVTIIAFVAYVPGFMNAFLVSTLLLDNRPRRALPARYPGVTVLIAAYNEADAIGDTLRSVLHQHYPGEVEVIVVDDGSTDATVAVARQVVDEAGPVPIQARIERVARNAGKAAALNHGLSLARHDSLVTLDGDSWLHPLALQRIVERRITDPASTRAVAGAVLVRNSRESWVTKAQEWDYFHGIAAVKRMQSMYHGTLVAQGAFSLYDREALDEVGGWPDCVGEDIVLSWALLKAGHRIGYAEDSLVFTDAPTGLRKFLLQRKRWARGMIEAFRHHSGLLLKPRMTTLFIWWNLLFVPLDLVFTAAFIPGVVLALFGLYYIVGPMTLAVLPLAIAWNLGIYRVQRRVLHRLGLRVRRNVAGFLFYVLGYNALMQPVSVWGYASEILGLRKRWDTK